VRSVFTSWNIVMRRLAMLIVVVWLPCVAPLGHAQSARPEAIIRAAIEQWTNDFNAGRSETVCNLFAPTLRADVRGAIERDYDAQCSLLRKALVDPDRVYSYAFDLKEIVVDRDMAVARLTWTTTTRIKSTGQAFTTRDRGLDIFSVDSTGNWRIVRYIAYEALRLQSNQKAIARRAERLAEPAKD
jgi:ketosteroid isomerase-like protein